MCAKSNSVTHLNVVRFFYKINIRNVLQEHVRVASMLRMRAFFVK